MINKDYIEKEEIKVSNNKKSGTYSEKNVKAKASDYKDVTNKGFAKRENKKNKFTVSKKAENKKNESKKTVPMVKKAEKKEDQTLYLIYMSPNELNARTINDYFMETGKVEVDLWDKLNILQLELPNKNTVEFEPLEPFTEDSDLEFLKIREVKTIFALTIEEEDFNEYQELLKGLLEKLGGFICTDTDDFMPIYEAADLKA